MSTCVRVLCAYRGAGGLCVSASRTTAGPM